MKLAQVVFPIPVDRPFSYAIPVSMDLQAGMRVEVPFGKASRKGLVIAIVEEAEATADGRRALEEGRIKEVLRPLDDAVLLPPGNLELGRWLAETCFCSLGEALWAMVPQAKEERDLEVVLDDGPALVRVRPELSDEQQAAVEQICRQTHGWYYLYGLTGSGKTEVYLAAAAHTLQEGRSVLFLVPEISLSAQMTREIESRFAGLCAVLHSRLTPSQRLGQWRRILNGEARLVVGARSAVFAPFGDLGLIIVDEEHEGGYKSSATPRYNARQVAMYRSRQVGARLVLGSATPSLEAWYQMKSGAMTTLRLTRRLAGGQAPEIRTVNMQGSQSSLSPELQDEIIKTHQMGRQTILFLNRRGFSYFFQCKSCMHELVCRHCSVSLTYHKERNLLICHYCGATQRPVQVCPKCGSLDLQAAGFGTEKISEELALLFPDLAIARLDADVVRRKGVLEHTIEDFRNGRIDLLLGTQMVAKGLNFPNLRLVGIINADVGLKVPDFRAMERTNALITQVAGRAGRYLPDGLVLIQTFNPANPGIAFAARNDLEGFYDRELQDRKELGFPPYTRVIKLVFRSGNPDKALHQAKEFLLVARRHLARGCEILGPAEAAIFKMNSSWRYQILLVHPSMKQLSAALRLALEGYKLPHDVHLEIDPDPVQLM